MMEEKMLIIVYGRDRTEMSYNKDSLKRFCIDNKQLELHETPQSKTGRHLVVYVTGCNNPEKKIEAIKLFRQLMGYGLRESKEAVEWMLGKNIYDTNGSIISTAQPVPFKAGSFDKNTDAEKCRMDFKSVGFIAEIKEEFLNGQ